MLEVNITNNDTGICEQQVHTDGYLLLYLVKDKVQSIGNIDLKVLAPLLTKVMLERLVK